MQARPDRARRFDGASRGETSTLETARTAAPRPGGGRRSSRGRLRGGSDVRGERAPRGRLLRALGAGRATGRGSRFDPADRKTPARRSRGDGRVPLQVRAIVPPVIAAAEVVDPDRGVHQNGHDAGRRRRGVSTSGSVPPSRPSRRALSSAISASRPWRTRTAFSWIPVSRLAFSRSESSMVMVVLIQRRMPQLRLVGKGKGCSVLRSGRRPGCRRNRWSGKKPFHLHEPR